MVARKVRKATDKNVFAHPSMVAELAFDKIAMSKLAAGIAGVRTIPSLTWSGALEVLRAPTEQVIVKPRSLTEGLECEIFATSLDLESSRFKASIDAGECLAQRFIEGMEFSVNAILSDQFTQVYEPISKSHNSKNDWQHPANRLRKTPDPEIPRDTVGRLIEITQSYLNRIPGRGLVELEFIVDLDGIIWFVELNPRLAATTRMSSLVSRRNLFSDLASASVGCPLTNGLMPTDGFSQEFKLTDRQLELLDISNFSFPEFSFSSRATVWGLTLDRLNQNVARLNHVLQNGQTS